MIELNEAKIGVAEACSGLSMLITFARVIDGRCPCREAVRSWIRSRSSQARSLWRCWRISSESSVTGVLHDKVGAHMATRSIMRLAGWLMIPART